MCGIFALLNKEEVTDSIKEAFLNGQNRGPEYSELIALNKLILGFHRLAINGLDIESNQPMTINNITLVCNGEIYNYIELSKRANIVLNSQSDCEIIIHLYEKYGIEQTLSMLDGVFAFVLYDNRISDNNEIYIARDPYGVRPLYILSDLEPTISHNIAVASELKVLYSLKSQHSIIRHFKPGTYSKLTMNKKIYIDYKYICNEVSYCGVPFNKERSDCTEYYYSKKIYNKLSEAVYKRVVGTTDRPIACLLSGGLDSSLITAFVNKFYNNGLQLETYSIGLEGSEDLKYSQLVADYLGTNHTQIIVTEDDFFNAIPEVIKVIESYDTTTVRASVGNYLIGKYIKKHSNAKVIFNGDGSDELTGGYMYFHHCPDEIEFDAECRRLLKDIHAYDVLRSDKSISSHGLEPRTPFLDRGFVEYYLSLPEKLRYHVANKRCEKFLLRNAINRIDPQLIPPEILWRTKEAFSDGVSSQSRSWYEIITEKCEEMIKNNPILKKNLESSYKFLSMIKEHNYPQTLEQTYYRYLYDSFYKGTSNLVPYFWMPRYINATDASARTLDVYEKNNKSKVEILNNCIT